MKAYLAWSKKAVGAGFAFIILWLSSLTAATIPEWLPVKYLPVATLLIGLAGTYTVWRLENGPKPTPEVEPHVI